MKLTLENLHMYCRQEGDCLIWNQGVNGKGYPQATIGDKGGVMVRRFVYETLMGRQLGKYRPVASRCGNHMCVAPDCLIRSSHGQVQKKAYRDGKRNPSLEYISRLRGAAERGMTKLDWGKVDEIRALLDTMPNTRIAKLYGVHEKTIWSIRHGYTWRKVTAAASVFQWRGSVAVNDDEAKSAA